MLACSDAGHDSDFAQEMRHRMDRQPAAQSLAKVQGKDGVF
jgi:hypothetical protein